MFDVRLELTEILEMFLLCLFCLSSDLCHQMVFLKSLNISLKFSVEVYTKNRSCTFPIPL